MKLTDQNLSEQLHLTGREIAQRKKLFGIGPEDELLLAQAGQRLAGVLAEVVDEFYQDQVAKPEVENLIGDAETLARLRQHLRGYLHTLLGGVYDDLYVLSRLRVGMVHNRIGVSPKLYVSSMCVLLGILRRHLAGPKLGQDCGLCQPMLSALEKIINFDLTLVFDTFIHSLVGQVERSRRELEMYAQGLEEEVANRTRQLSEQALTDPLTGLGNRRALFDSLRREVAGSLRQARPLAVLCLDLDGFKAVNDQFGHEEGDHVLVQTAAALRKAVRKADLPVRMGGDEFAALLPGATLAMAREVAQRFLEDFDRLKGPHGMSVSIGLAGLDMDMPQPPEVLLRQADEALYRAKKTPGNAIESAEPAE